MWYALTGWRWCQAILFADAKTRIEAVFIEWCWEMAGVAEVATLQM